MGKELEEVKKRMTASKDYFDGDDEFNTYTKIYMQSNENLKEYVKDLDDKRVLSVAASGDHLFSSLLNGATNIDIFDINKYALMFIELRKYALRYLDPVDILYFFTYLNVESYLKFNDYLPDNIKEFFDYIFLYCDREEVNERFFQDICESLNNTPYQNTKQLKELKDRLELLNSHAYNCNLYSLPNFIEGKYDVIYLSNILAYELNYDRMFNFVRMMKECYLNDGGELYYDYIWTIKKNVKKDKLYTRKNNQSIDAETIERHRDIYDATEPIILPPAHDNHFKGPRAFNDVVLRIRK